MVVAIAFGINNKLGGNVMATSNEYIGNRGGIPLIAATQTTAGSSSANAVFSMPNHTFRAVGNAGIIVVNFNAATTTATGVNLEVNNVILPLLNAEGNTLITLTAGLHIIVFDKQNNKLQLVV